MVETTIKHGNAIIPYRVVKQQDFHTVWAAQLFGSMNCTDLYTYWTTCGNPTPHPQILSKEP